MSEVEKLTSAERKELEALRAAKAQREREESGIDTGQLLCPTPDCSKTEWDVDLQKVVMRTHNPETGHVENEYVSWKVMDEADALCPECEFPVTVIEPHAESAFPRNYRPTYPVPAAKGRTGMRG